MENNSESLRLPANHDFKGRPDRDCEICGKPDRHECHMSIGKVIAKPVGSAENSLSDTKFQNDGGIWICHTCKTVIGPIVDDDENMCGCDVYEFEHSRYVPDVQSKSEIQSLHDRITELEGLLKTTVTRMNPVTAQHRHHDLPTKKALDMLSNHQIDIEKSLSQQIGER